MNNKRLLGRITRLEATRARGFGFIMTPAGVEYFMHKKSCEPQAEFDRLQEGQIVAFVHRDAAKGPAATKTRAANQEEQHAYEQQEEVHGESRGNR